ncbi:MAG: hypothetical protein ACI9VN_000342 [Patescibacteria group bacterium]|jgi:hypothetical protein
MMILKKGEKPVKKQTSLFLFRVKGSIDNLVVPDIYINMSANI